MLIKTEYITSNGGFHFFYASIILCSSLFVFLGYEISVHISHSFRSLILVQDVQCCDDDCIRVNFHEQGIEIMTLFLLQQ